MAALRIGIIGYGMAGRSIHAQLAREAGYRVTAVVVRNQARRQQAASDWPGVRILDDVAQLVAVRNLFDLAVVASPTAFHAEHAAALARAGIPFVVDKPIGVDAFEARAVLSEAEATGTPFTVFQNRRWDAEQLTLVEVLRRRALGEVHTFERRWERWRPTPRKRWREDDVVGGGLLLDLGAHLVDSALQLFGPARSVWAQVRNLTTPADDDVFLVLEHAAGGGVAASAHPVISRLWAGSLVAAPGPRTRVLGSAAAFVVTKFEEEANAFDLVGTEGKRAAGWLVGGGEPCAVTAPAGGHIDFYRDLTQWLAGEVPAPVDPYDAIRTADVLDAARISARTGNAVQLDLVPAPTLEPPDAVA